MRLGENEQPGEPKAEVACEYEPVGYVPVCRAELHLEGTVVELVTGDSCTVPKDAAHTQKSRTLHCRRGEQPVEGRAHDARRERSASRSEGNGCRGDRQGASVDDGRGVEHYARGDAEQHYRSTGLPPEV